MTTTETTARSEARVPTEHASRYLQQLCKHWSHKFPVSFDPTHGVVPFPDATCAFEASPEALTLTLTAPPERLEHMEGVVARHLERFAFRETLDIRWTRRAA